MNFSFFHTALHLSHSVIFCEILQLFREIATPDRFSYKHRWARGGGAQWSETHSDPPKNPKNCTTVLQITFTESLTCSKMDFDNFRHF